jgi:gamma-glutamyl:cysteine ligase YbdK (ATP-grasp superfamily)
VLGPEHEFSLVNDQLKALPIVDCVLKDFYGRVVNSVKLRRFSFAKELQLHVMEVKPNEPFYSPVEFEETMNEAVQTLQGFIGRKYGAHLLGTGMHPLLRLDETNVWPHRHRQIYEAFGKIFNLKRHGWLNIQSYQLNLPYSNEGSGVLLHNLISTICPYLPAISASSPIFEGKFGDKVDNRLCFYRENQKEVPSITGDIIPEYVTSFSHYRRLVIDAYSQDLATRGASKLLLGKEWVNSRGAIFRFDRRAIELRVMDEQECVKSDVSLSCFIRALLRGLMKEKLAFATHDVLLEDFNSIVNDGLRARLHGNFGAIAKKACASLLRIAYENATEEEKKYLSTIGNRIEKGSLSEIIRARVEKKSQRTDLKEAIVNVYLQLAESLIDNQPYF